MSYRNRSCGKLAVRRSAVLVVIIMSSTRRLIPPVAVVEGYAVTTTSKAAPFFSPAPTNIASAEHGVPIEMPNFEELFHRIQQVSPLAQQVIQRGSDKGERGFQYIDDSSSSSPDLHWKRVESNSKRTVFQIDKTEHYMNLSPPLIRFRVSLKGPCVGDVFSKFLTDMDYRKKWDAQIAICREMYIVKDLDTVNTAMGSGTYGDCAKFGVGYCKTRKNLGISPREQLTQCGVQNFKDGACIIWGTEMEEWHNHLLPKGPRVPRGKGHLFATTLVPTGGNTFDVEYILQMDLGGIPNWIGTPVLIDSVKHLFKYAEEYYGGGEDGEVYKLALERAERDALLDGESCGFLMPQ